MRTELHNIEYKRELTPELEREVVSYLNCHLGGTIFIGVKNNDEESKTYRPYKQIEERLNRTYKQNYYGTNGYGSLECANSYMVLYVAFFNFLRRHSSLGFKTPVDDGLFDDSDLMSDKWLKLISLAHQYNKAYLPA